MNKTIIIIVANIGHEKKIPVAKKALRSYFGERLLEEDEAEAPAVSVKCKISKDDKKNVDKLISANFDEKITLIFIENNSYDGDFISTDYSSIIETVVCEYEEEEI